MVTKVHFYFNSLSCYPPSCLPRLSGARPGLEDPRPIAQAGAAGGSRATSKNQPKRPTLAFFHLSCYFKPSPNVITIYELE